MNRASDHEKDWFDKSPEERLIEYGARKAALEEVLVDIRLHRMEQCPGAPLCPGADASERLSKIPPGQIGDFIATCLAMLADDRQEIENLRVQLDQERDRAGNLRERLADLKKESDAGWEAYRQERAAHERTGRNLDDDGPDGAAP